MQHVLPVRDARSRVEECSPRRGFFFFAAGAAKKGAAVAAADHVRTVAALVTLLEMLERRVAQLRTVDGLPRQAAAHAHLRSALTYEREVLKDLTDHTGMFQQVGSVVADLANLSPAESLAVLSQEVQA